MSRAITIETSLAAWSLVGGVLANIAGFMLIGRLAGDVPIDVEIGRAALLASSR
jgi:hypothetical protein